MDSLCYKFTSSTKLRSGNANSARMYRKSSLPLLFGILIGIFLTSTVSIKNYICYSSYVRKGLEISVPDPNQYVVGPPGSASGSISYKYGSGFGSFHHQAKKIVEKP
jgi:hypothetical protein